MSLPSIETDDRSSTFTDDNMSITVQDLSDSTVTSRTSSSWHSGSSEAHVTTNPSIRSYSINTWLKTCSIEPDIRLTTAQEWKLRNCMRRLISLFNLPLKISLIKTNKNEFSPLIDQQGQQLLSKLDFSSTTLITHPWLSQGQNRDKLEQLGLYLRIMSMTTVNNTLLEAKLFEYFSNTIVHIPLVKQAKFVFHIALNILKLSLRSMNSLLELHISTRESEAIRGSYYKWNDEYCKFNATVGIDHSLIDQFNTI